MFCYQEVKLLKGLEGLGGVNENGPHRLIYGCLYTREWHYLRGTRRCGLVGESVSLGVGFEVSEAHARHSQPLPPFLCLWIRM